MNERFANGHVHASKLVKSRTFRTTSPAFHAYASYAANPVIGARSSHPSQHNQLTVPGLPSNPRPVTTHQCSQPNAALRPRGPPEQQSLGAEQSASKAPGIREPNN
ncbi:hypothetical protein E4U12_007118 [Claviceps purpurea]|nr:hypothetical protein E4U12_007118 [Claviceps purpurea]